RFGAAGEHDIRLPEADLIGGVHDGAKARAARLIDRIRRRLVPQTALDRDLPRDVRTDARLARVAEDDFVDIRRIDPAAGKRRLRRLDPELRRSHRSKRPAELP